jgi:hypothetical protein
VAATPQAIPKIESAATPAAAASGDERSGLYCERQGIRPYARMRTARISGILSGFAA